MYHYYYVEWETHARDAIRNWLEGKLHKSCACVCAWFIELTLFHSSAFFCCFVAFSFDTVFVLAGSIFRRDYKSHHFDECMSLLLAVLLLLSIAVFIKTFHKYRIEEREKTHTRREFTANDVQQRQRSREGRQKHSVDIVYSTHLHSLYIVMNDSFNAWMNEWWSSVTFITFAHTHLPGFFSFPISECERQYEYYEIAIVFNWPNKT